MRSAFFWDITRRRVVNVYRRFGTTYRSNLHGSRVPKERRSHQHRGGSLKPRYSEAVDAVRQAALLRLPGSNSGLENVLTDISVILLRPSV
jgi:hypothetical protein